MSRIKPGEWACCAKAIASVGMAERNAGYVSLDLVLKSPKRQREHSLPFLYLCVGVSAVDVTFELCNQRLLIVDGFFENVANRQHAQHLVLLHHR